MYEQTLISQNGSGLSTASGGMTVIDSNSGAPMSIQWTPKSVMQSFFEGELSSEQISQRVNGNDNPTPKCDTNDDITNDTKTPKAKKIQPFTNTRREYNGHVSAGNVDKRVSLTVAPRTEHFDETLFVDKVNYVLGQKSATYSWMLSGSKFYGLLRSALGTTSGLIFPYTPSVSFSHTVEYDTTSITHTNLSYNYYKCTPPPSVSLKGKFTADNRQNALHMLSAIWFLTACSKCDYGELTSNPGLPPPIIYLSGYNSTIDNIPVVIKSFNYTYPEDKHYVNLVLDLSKDNTAPQSEFCKVYDYTTTIDSYSSFADKAKGINPFSSRPISKNGGINLSFWLPTEISIDISLAIQPNLIKHKKQWSLERYKSGYLMTNSGKNPGVSFDTMDTKLVENGFIRDENCNKIHLFKEENVKEGMKFIPSGWTW